jgi:hypothetical protein
VGDTLFRGGSGSDREHPLPRTTTSATTHPARFVVRDRAIRRQ